ncbi:uncharacterized protein M421DRAFT_421704 [Didymella exigua CBS 183.55]|uniref:PNPLA domain-containing protein n=1 Tax=Didymella exigua CBS 183.55 TaxID=1150837 RepID=A0A6A5RG80_9PLEO|nr:uncharacterized protein M421DRAFT_421704 [Didymella exigua CBS 183.55]KAF1927305.1 hypothetical protein M421DRAFT_421704 [Didymella exigua CBS 183.55]
MTILSVGSLVEESTRTANPVKPRSVGQYVGRFGTFGPHCWELRDSFRHIYSTDIRPLILTHLGGRIGSVSNQGSITITAYMVGRRASTAAPTVLFVSESDGHRKEARKLVKESGILGQHRGWKTAQASRDPSWGGELEQLASGSSSINAGSPGAPTTEVFYNPSQALRSRGMTLYISHRSGLRVFTANLVRAQGDVYYQGPAHAFFDRIEQPTTKFESAVDDFEIDSDDQTETIRPDDETDAGTVEVDCQVWSSDEESEDSGVSSAEDSDDDNSSQSSFGAEGLDYASPRAQHDPPERLFSQLPITDGFSLPKPDIPALASLLPFGTLERWSTDKDWALVKMDIATMPSVAAFLAASHEDLSMLSTARPRSTGTPVVVQTTSSGRLTGIITGTASDTRVPFGSSFEEVFSARLNGPLADGDCGAVVIDAVTGELYGHIIAGCRATGYAQVMAASHVMPDILEPEPVSNAALITAESGLSLAASAFDVSRIDFESYSSFDLHHRSDRNDSPQIGWVGGLTCYEGVCTTDSSNTQGAYPSPILPLFHEGESFDADVPFTEISPATPYSHPTQDYLSGLRYPSLGDPWSLFASRSHHAPADLYVPGSHYDTVGLRPMSNHTARSRHQQAQARTDGVRTWFDEVVLGNPRSRNPHRGKEILVLRWGDARDHGHKQEIITMRNLFEEKLHVGVRCHVVQLPRSGDLQARATAHSASHASRCEDSNSVLYIYNSGKDVDAQCEAAGRSGHDRAASCQLDGRRRCIRSRDESGPSFPSGEGQSASRAPWDVEMQTRGCGYCVDPHEAHRRNDPLCEQGHGFAGDDACSAMLLEAARATSAAPFYFAPSPGGHLFIDGGIHHNDPTAPGISESGLLRASKSTAMPMMWIDTGRSPDLITDLTLTHATCQIPSTNTMPLHGGCFSDFAPPISPATCRARPSSFARSRQRQPKLTVLGDFQRRDAACSEWGLSRQADLRRDCTGVTARGADSIKGGARSCIRLCRGQRVTDGQQRTFESQQPIEDDSDMHNSADDLECIVLLPTGVYRAVADCSISCCCRLQCIVLLPTGVCRAVADCSAPYNLGIGPS